MRHVKTGLAPWAALALFVPWAAAHEDMIAPLEKVEKVYATPAPLGQLRVVYSAAKNATEASLRVDCVLFRGSVPAEGLADLPRPDWDRFVAAYSLTSFESGKWTQRPYVYVSVPLNGPAGKAWEQTWVTFHFDADGKLLRRIKRFVPDAATKSIQVLWRDWQVGSGVSAEAALEGANE